MSTHLHSNRSGGVECAKCVIAAVTMSPPLCIKYCSNPYVKLAKSVYVYYIIGSFKSMYVCLYFMYVCTVYM